jgi:hypothetical protein
VTERVSRLIALGCVLTLASCLQLGNHAQADAGASGGAGGELDAAAAPVGANCASDPSSGVTLCSAISSCPDVPVDPDQYPGCGYRIRGSALDLECLCGDSLCPIGVALSCAQARSLLADQSALAVCAGVAEGRCTAVATLPHSGGSCDPECRTSCAGDPSCTVLCGC